MDAKVYMATACGRLSPSSAFFDCFYQTVLPEGSFRQRAVGNNYAAQMNIIIDEALKGGYTHICYVDDDFLFSPDLVVKLLTHDVEACSPLITQRLPPFRACIFDAVDESGKLRYKLLNGETGLIKTLGTGGMPTLVKTSIFEKLSKPYFPDTMIDESGECWEGSILFVKKLIAAGIDVWIDLERTVWHLGNYSVTAQLIDGVWKNVIRIHQTNINIPMAD